MWTYNTGTADGFDAAFAKLLCPLVHVVYSQLVPEAYLTMALTLSPNLNPSEFEGVELWTS